MCSDGKTAEKLGAQIVTNDRYKDGRDEFPWVEERRVPVMIVEDRVVLYEENLEGARAAGHERR